MTNPDTKYSILIVLSGLFCGLLVASNAAGAKIISLGSYPYIGTLSASATVISYSFSFLITDIISEFYGKKTAHMTVIAGFFSVLIGSLFFKLAVYWQPAEFFVDQRAYETVFDVSFRIFLGGSVAYIISQNLDVITYYHLKNRFNGNHLWLRNIVSTLLGQFIDTFVFIMIAFLGTVDNISDLIIGQYIIKFAISIVHTPLMYLTRKLFRDFVLKGNC